MKNCCRTVRFKILILAFVFPTFAIASVNSAQKDSGWVDLFNGTNFNGLYTFLVGPDLNGQSYNNDPHGTYKAENGLIHGFENVNQGHIGTIKEYSRYRCRVEYRLIGTTGSTNAGLVYHIDTSSWKLYGQHPRSIECQMKHNEAGWALLIANVWIHTTVTASTQNSDYPTWQDLSQGGVPYIQGDRDPRRVIIAPPRVEHYPPDTAWNIEEIRVYGSDSTIHYVNGQRVFKGTQILYDVVKDDTTHKAPLNKGHIGLQAEGNEVFYRNWQVMELDLNGNPVTSTQTMSRKNIGKLLPVFSKYKVNGKKFITQPFSR